MVKNVISIFRQSSGWLIVSPVNIERVNNVFIHCLLFAVFLADSYLLTLNLSMPSLRKPTDCLAAAIPALILASAV